MILETVYQILISEQMSISLVIGFIFLTYLLSRILPISTSFIISYETSYVGLLLIFLLRSKFSFTIEYFLTILMFFIVLQSLVFLTRNSIYRYLNSYSKTERYLFIFYFTLLMTWTGHFILVIYSVRVNATEHLLFQAYVSIVSFMLWVLSAIIIYFIAKHIFFPKNTTVTVYEYLLFTVYGFSLGIMLLSPLNTVQLRVFGLKNTFNVPFVLSFNLGALIGYTIILISIFTLSYYSRKARYDLLRKIQRQKIRIDPIALPRLKLTEYSMYMILGSVLNYLILGLPDSFLKLPVMLHGLLSLSLVVLLAVTVLFLLIAFQTPENIKRYWRQNH